MQLLLAPPNVCFRVRTGPHSSPSKSADESIADIIDPWHPDEPAYTVSDIGRPMIGEAEGIASHVR